MDSEKAASWSSEQQRPALLCLRSNSCCRLASQRKLMISTLANIGVAINFASIEVAILLMRHGERLESSWTMSVLDSLVFVGCIFGMLAFGYVGDVLGRIVGLRVAMVVAIVGIAASLSPLVSPTQLETVLMCSRFVVGVGCGGCYPLSAALAYEREHEAKMAELSVAVANFGQSVGSLVLYLVALALYAFPVSSAALWRIVLLVGALPFALAVGLTYSLRVERQEGKATETPLADSLLSPLRQTLAGAALTWFAYNTYAYGIITLAPQLSATILGDDTLTNLGSNLAASIAAVFAAALSLGYIKRYGARNSVIVGAAASAVYGIALSAVYAYDAASPAMFLWLFVALRGLIQWPGIGVFTIPTVFPKTIRSRAHGVASALGKLGAILGSATYPLILDAEFGGLTAVLWFTAFACAATSAICASLAPTEVVEPDPTAKPAGVSWRRRDTLPAASPGFRTWSPRSKPAPSMSGDRRPYSELDPLIEAPLDAHDRYAP